MIDELLAPLAPEEPADDEIRRLLARADRRTKRRRFRLAAATATAAAAIVATLAALPGRPQGAADRRLAAHDRRRARRRPAEPAGLDRLPLRPARSSWRTSDRYTLERTEESWTSSDWQGVPLSPGAQVVAGTIPPHARHEQRAATSRSSSTACRRPSGPRRASTWPRRSSPTRPEVRAARPADRDPAAACPTSTATARWPRSRSRDLPTDPQQLGTLLIEAHKDGRWTPGGSWHPLLESNVKYDVLRDILLLLTQANATPAAACGADHRADRVRGRHAAGRGAGPPTAARAAASTSRPAAAPCA